MKLEHYDLLGERISQIMSYASLVITLGLLPIALICIIFVDSKSLKDEKFKARWLQLYSHMNYEKRAKEKLVRAYFLIFVLRRIFLVLISFKKPKIPII